MNAGCLLRRWVLLASLVAMAVAHAQGYPVRPIHFIVGSAPGSVIDVVTRQIGEGLAHELRQPVLVENRFSAGGIVALQALKGSPSDRDKAFYEGKVATAKFFARTILPELTARRAIAEATDLELMELPEAAF